MLLYYYSPNISDSKVEVRARKLGMMYPNEIKAYFNNDKK